MTTTPALQSDTGIARAGDACPNSVARAFDTGCWGIRGRGFKKVHATTSRPTVTCSNPDHDHVSPEANRCVDCGEPTHYDEAVGYYVHDDLFTECWQIAAWADTDALGLPSNATPCYCTVRGVN